MRRTLYAAALTTAFVAPELIDIALDDCIFNTAGRAGRDPSARPSDDAGRGSPLEGRLIGMWVSVGHDTATLEYRADGRLIERIEGGVYTARYRVVSPTQYEIYDPETDHAFRFTVHFPNPDLMTLISTTGMRTEWRRARGPG